MRGGCFKGWVIPMFLYTNAIKGGIQGRISCMTTFMMFQILDSVLYYKNVNVFVNFNFNFLGYWLYFIVVP